MIELTQHSTRQTRKQAALNYIYAILGGLFLVGLLVVGLR